MLFEFLNFLGLSDNKINNKTKINSKNSEDTEIINSNEKYNIDIKEFTNSKNEKIQEATEIIPLGNGKALKIVKTKIIGRI